MKIAILFLSLSLLACGFSPPAMSPHDVARSAVIAMAGAARQLHTVCLIAVEEGLTLEDPVIADRTVQLAHVCQQNLDFAVPALEAIARDVDAWDDRTAMKTACSVLRAAGALITIKDALVGYGAKVPWELDQALMVGKAAGALCTVTP